MTFRGKLFTFSGVTSVNVYSLDGYTVSVLGIFAPESCKESNVGVAEISAFALCP